MGYPQPMPTRNGNIISVLIVDDSRTVRSTVSQFIAWGGSDLVVAATAATGAEAIEVAQDGLQFDVALVDLGLPDIDGTRVIAQLGQIRPEALCIAFTVNDQVETILGAIAAGARGYILKGTSPERLLASIREVFDGGAPLTPKVARIILDRMLPRKPLAPQKKGGPLTPRENEVLSLLSRGSTYAEVARGLGIGLGTVQSHVKSIYRKLNVKSKTEAATLAIQRGLV